MSSSTSSDGGPLPVRTGRAAILAESRAPLVVDTVELPERLDAGQVLVKVLYTSICGAQLNEIAAARGPDPFLPHLLGHEASAEVIAVGPGVTTAAPRDTVVLHWRPGLGIQSRTPSYRWRGARLNAGLVTTFNEYAVVSENRMTVIPHDYDRRTAPLLGCAATTALGVVGNDAKVKIGASLVVFGVGGVGLNVVQFARLAGAHPIIAVDVIDRKLDRAARFGATHAVNAQRDDAAAVVRGIVGPDGPDNVIETTGVKSVIELAYDLTGPRGTCVLVGVPSEKASLYTLPLHLGKVLTGSHGGGAEPHLDIPRIIRLQRAGRVSFDGMITHEFALAEINDALDLVRRGEAGRVLLDVRRDAPA
jgi:S-(hydroxymethyl)glutathione dehydrogenase/alcohol dehydrogenase